MKKLILGVSGTILIVTSLGVTADLIGLDTNSGAFVYGAMSFVDKISNGVAVMAIQYWLVFNFLFKIMFCSTCNLIFLKVD